MKTCNCHSADAGAGTLGDVCATGTLEHPRYFARQLLTPAELTLEQQYLRDKQRRHNRLLHGWGVVCGATVCRVPETPVPGAPPAPPRAQPWKVHIEPGYILGPFGDEILIESDQVVDLRTQGVNDGSADTADPWCVPVLLDRALNGPFYVAVRYQQIASRPVRVQPAGCGCDDSPCELSRWRDGFTTGVLTTCPDDQQKPPKLTDLFQGPIPDCPDCPTSPWVVLARVDLDPDGTIRLIDNCSCRRLVLSAAALWWQCKSPLAINRVTVDPAGNPKPNSDIRVTIDAMGLPKTLTVDFGQGLTVKDVKVADDQTSVLVTIHVELNAAPGMRTLTLWDTGGCLLGVVADALTVDAA